MMNSTQTDARNPHSAAFRRGLLNGAAAVAVLVLLGGTAKAGDETATWVGGSGMWSNAAQWLFAPDAALTGTTVPNNGNASHTYDVRIDNGNPLASSVTLDIGVTIDSLNISSGDSLSFNNDQDLSIVSATGITNNGAINLNSGGNLTDLNLLNGAGLSGSGSVTMGDNANNRILTNGVNFTNASGHTIQGAGQILANTGGMTNAGLIDGNQTNNALVIDPRDDLGVTNTGTLRGSSTAGLLLQNGPFTNTGGVIEGTAGGSVSVNSASVSGGTLQGAGSIFLNNGTLADLTNTGTLVQNNDADSTASGTVTNNGTWQLNSAGNFTDLNLNGATLAGSGSVAMGDNANNRILTNGSVGVNGANHTIHGAGQILANTGGMTNNGLINADQTNNALVIDPRDDLGFTNNGTLRGSGTAGLVLQNGPFTNTGAIIEALTGSSVSINNATVSGGTLQGAGNIFLSGATLDTLTSTGTLVQNNDADSTASGTVTNNGTWQLNSGGNLTDLNLNDATLAGSGSVAMSDNPNNRILTNGFSGTNEAGHTIRGAGQLLANTGAMLNKGTIIAEGANSLVIDPRDGFDLASGNGFQNGASGVLQAGDTSAGTTGSLVLQNGTFESDNVIEAQTGSSVSINNATVSGGTLQGAGSIFLSGATLDTLTNRGTLVQNNDADSTASGTVTNNGTWQLSSNGNLTDLNLNDATLAGTGSVAMSDNPNNRILTNGLTGTNGTGHTIQGAGQILANTGGMVNNGTMIADQANNAMVIDPRDDLGFDNVGTLRASGAAGLQVTSSGSAFTITTGTSGFRNQGQMIVDHGSSAGFNANYFQSAGTTQVDGAMTAPGFDIAGGVLKGTGTLNGAVALGNATVAPGDSPGTLTINGTFAMGPNGHLQIEIDSLSSFDVLNVLGAASLDGSLDVITDSVFAHNGIQVGDTFDVVFGSSMSDGLDALTSNITGLTFDKQVLASAGGQFLRLTVTGTPGPVPVPPALPLMGSALAALALLRRRGRKDEA